ncbi:MAG: hypothetical protein ACR2QJ_04125 [Geminicoccaceae bacterium]
MSEISWPERSTSYGYAVCGLGPAGCGFLLHAIKEDEIGRLVDKGLVLIDRSAHPGAGKVGDYKLTGNSLSRAFLDCIDDPKLAWLLGDLAVAASPVIKLRDIELLAPPLDVVGDFLTAIAERTIAYLSEAYRVPVLLDTEVEAIDRKLDQSFALTLHGKQDGHRQRLAVDNVLCSLGGRQMLGTIRQCELQPGLKLGAHAERIIASDDFLMMPDDVIQKAIPLSTDGTRDVVIVGGSHSAMSTIDRLTDALGPLGLERVIMLHREPLRLYYASPDEARSDGYSFDDPGDICPMSGRVNRFGGLRYRSFDVGKSILETGRTPDQSVEVVSVRLDDPASANAAAVQSYLAKASAVIACLGYQANLPPVVDHANREIELRNQPRGLEIDDEGRALAADGRPVPGLYVFGIGSRLLRRSDAIGGEPSFRGSADGVWLYHNHGGGVILNALTKGHSTKPEEHARKTPRPNFVDVAVSA